MYMMKSLVNAFYAVALLGQGAIRTSALKISNLLMQVQSQL